MSASTRGILFFGFASDDSGLEPVEWETWERLAESERKIGRLGLVCEALDDGETTGYFLAVKASVTEVGAGVAQVVTPTVIPQWLVSLNTCTQSNGFPDKVEPRWHVACATDRDY